MGGWVCGWLGMSIEIGQVIITACADVIQRPGCHQVLLYKCTKAAKQLMCTSQLVQASIVCAPLVSNLTGVCCT